MPYSVNNTDSSLNFTVQDSAVDSNTLSISLIGTNADNYADDLARNDVHLLENFASISAPTAGTVLTGQLWYDKTDNVLRLYKGSTGEWINLETIISDEAPNSTAPRSNKSGETYFNSSNNKGYLFDGSWKPTGYAGEVTSAFSNESLVANPTKFGSKVRAIFLKDTSGRPHPCLALVHVNNSTTSDLYGSSTNGETLMAIFNHDTSFTADNISSTTEGESINYYAELNATGGIGVLINKGMNLRSDYVAEAVSLATRAVTADKANALQVGGVVINATDFARKSDDIIPTANATYSLGSSTLVYDTAFVQRIDFASDQAQITAQVDNKLKIGSSSKKVKEIYTYDLFATDDVTVGDDLSVTGNSNLTGNVDVTNHVQVNQNITSNAVISAVTYTHNAHSFQINQGDISGAEDITSNGTITWANLNDGAQNITQFDTSGTLSSNLDTRLPTQKAVKTYVDTANANMKTYVDTSQAAQDLDVATDSGSIDILIDSETLTIAGGDGIGSTGAGTTATLAVDNTVARTNVNETFDANVIISGNLTVSGTTTTVNSATLSVADNEITLNSDVTGTPSENAGLEVERGSSTNVRLRWNETTDKWQFTNDGTTYTDIITYGSLSVSTASASGNGGLSYNNTSGVLTFTPADTSLATKTTANLAEGSNLYYTDARVLTKIQATAATQLSDVSYSSPNDGQTLQWNAGNSRWEAATPSSGVTTLVNLTDVDAGGSSTGQVLQKAANGNFTFGSVSSSNNYADSLAFATGTGILTVGRSGLGDLTVDLDGRYATTNTTYSAATNSALGLIKIGYTDNAKNYAVELDGDSEAYVNVPWSDTTYTTATASALGLVKIGFTESGKNYPVELSSDQMYVNVPWTDNNDNTVYSAGSGITKNTAGTSAGAFSHSDTSSVSDLTATARTYVKALTFDTYGHVTGYSTGVETDQSFSDTNYYLNSASFNTSNGVLTLGVNGAANQTVDLDGRYLTSFTESYQGTVTSVTGGTGVSSSGGATPSLSIGQAVATSSNVQFNRLGVGMAAQSTNGRIDASNDVIAYSTSDERLKENVNPIQNALDKLSQIRGVEFDWKELTEEEKQSIHSNEGHDVGVIAQEVEKVLPEVVTERDTGYKAVKYEKIVPLLIEAMKELKAEVDDLKKQLNK